MRITLRLIILLAFLIVVLVHIFEIKHPVKLSVSKSSESFFKSAALCTTENSGQYCYAPYSVYWNITVEEFDAIKQIRPNQMIKHCDQTNITWNDIHEMRRYSYLKDLVSLKNMCLVTKELTPDYLEYIQSTIPVDIHFYEERTCNKIYLKHFQTFCKIQNGTITPSIIHANKPLFYNPVLIKIPGGAVVNRCRTVIKKSSVFAYISPCKSEFTSSLGPPNELGPIDFDLNTLPKYDKVFVIAQYWGENPYHGLVECMPRLAEHYQELMQMKDIKIHVRSKTNFLLNYLYLLGFTPERIVEGDISANVVYLPEASFSCGTAGFYQVRKQQQNLRSRFLDLFPAAVDSSNKYCLIIKRNFDRRITNYDEMLIMTREKFKGYIFDIFDDLQLPNANETFKLFYRADVIVAPHGAGLGNLVIGKPGAILIEFLTHEINLCYAQLMVQLGIHYHGYLPEKSHHLSTITIDPGEYLKLLDNVKIYQ